MVSVVHFLAKTFSSKPLPACGQGAEMMATGVMVLGGGERECKPFLLLWG